jgi:succinate dehydrogenase / fumarate reductase cytochrome b subunit
MLGGIRHLIWDTGHGFGLNEREGLSLATIVGSVTLTLLLWIVGYFMTGGAQ